MHTTPRGARGGSAVHHGNERLEPTPRPPKTQPTLDPIDVFAPGADDAEKDLRRRLARAQTIGSARAVRTQSDDARCLWWQVAQVASAWTFARASKDNLADVLRACSQMFLAANTFERLESRS